MVIDISKITSENYTTYNEIVKYEIPKQRQVRNIKSKKCKTEEEKKQHIKEYQHQYYLQVTKIKREIKKRTYGG